ncbi:MAG TPA: Uma2 family endonuclease [Bacteroidetes bacterium]|nr:Uma2 family endonuclease [Bacteroidota bacterium]
MFDDNNLVNKILEQPGAMLIVQEAQARLQEEQRKRQEFYDLIGEDDKAEFVNGEIIFHSPVVKIHTDATGGLYLLLRTYVQQNGLGWVGIEKVMTRFTRNDYEPDICFFGNEKAALFEDKQLLFPVPDFVAEVLSKSSQKTINHDRVTKYNDYELHGVSEYWIVDPHEKTVEQYILENNKYRLVLKSSEGIVRSHSVAGFNIPIPSVFDSKENRKILRDILKGSLPT